MAVRARRTLAAEELEARVLFSADLAPHAGIDSALVAHHRDQEQDGAIEVAFVDAGLENVGGLLAALQAEEGGGRTLEIVMLEPDGDGIDQIGNALAQYRDVSAIHLFTHGGNGRLALGSVDLDDATLASRSTEIAAWGDALGTAIGASEDAVVRTHEDRPHHPAPRGFSAVYLPVRAAGRRPAATRQTGQY